MELVGVDFTSAPRRRKPIVWARGRREGDVLRYAGCEDMTTFDAFEAALRRPGPWLGAFDLPFGLPRALVEHLGWPTAWPDAMRQYAAQSREDLRRRFVAFCAGRPAGGKFAHRATDLPAGSSPSMKWVNPPVAWMMHAGVPRLIAAGVHLPGLADGDRSRIVLEGYPALVARDLIGRRSYKSDTRAKQTAQRRAARAEMLAALEAGRSRFGVRLALDHGQREALVDDAAGDRLDALLCLVTAAWASATPGYGLPDGFDPLEGWIVGAQAPESPAP